MMMMMIMMTIMMMMTMMMMMMMMIIIIIVYYNMVLYTFATVKRIYRFSHRTQILSYGSHFGVNRNTFIHSHIVNRWSLLYLNQQSRTKGRLVMRSNIFVNKTNSQQQIFLVEGFARFLPKKNDA